MTDGQKSMENKRVCLIGPAPHTAEIDQSEYIKSFDVVVRINNALPIPDELKKTTTDRCDVLYVWRKILPNSSWNNLKEIRLKPDAIFSHQWNKKLYEPYKEILKVVSPEHFYGLSKELGSRANTGLMAIEDILSEKPKELYITGLTFYRGVAYHDSYKGLYSNDRVTKNQGTMDKHNQDHQIKYFIKKCYNKVNCDETLNKIINDYKSNNTG